MAMGALASQNDYGLDESDAERRARIRAMMARQPAVTAGAGVRGALAAVPGALAEPFHDIAKGLGGGMTNREARDYAAAAAASLLVPPGAGRFASALGRIKPNLEPAAAAVRMSELTGAEVSASQRAFDSELAQAMGLNQLRGARHPEARLDLYPNIGYHGTGNTFSGFRVDPFLDNFVVDQALGPHIARDPELANAFANRLINWGRNPDVRRGSPQVIPVRYPATERFLEVPQKVIHPDPYDAPWNRIQSDAAAIANLASTTAFQADKDLLKRYFMRREHLPSYKAEKLADEYHAGDPKYIKELVDIYGGMQSDPYLGQGVVDTSRNIWKDKGYAGLKYENTAPNEVGMMRPGAHPYPTEYHPDDYLVKDRTSLIVFDPKDVRSPFAEFDPRKININDFGAAVAGAGVMGALASGDAYKLPEQ